MEGPLINAGCRALCVLSMAAKPGLQARPEIHEFCAKRRLY
ncbi:MAG: hypothetical protein ACOX7P_02055 [Oscillospiraceae bacterium]